MQKRNGDVATSGRNHEVHAGQVDRPSRGSSHGHGVAQIRQHHVFPHGFEVEGYDGAVSSIVWNADCGLNGRGRPNGHHVTLENVRRPKALIPFDVFNDVTDTQ